MDARHYDAIKHVAPGHFTAGQRRRLEAFTAAVGLLGKDRDLDELLNVADFIAGDA